MREITFELPGALMIFAISLAISIVLTAIFIPLMKKLQFQQFQREEGPKSHMVKQGTPSMGGIAIVLATVVASLIMCTVDNVLIVIILATVAFALVGFIDDYGKAVKKQNEGLKPMQKIVLQVAFAVGFAFYMANFSGYGTNVWIPFIDKFVDFGIWYIPFVVFILLAMTNSVNLTDGMDGLASGITTLVAITFALIGITFTMDNESLFCIALAAACVGFLVFNKYPAKIFMGDTGSMALGAAISAVAIAMKVELLLPVAGLIYVVEALSVIIQVFYFKLTGKRVFRMAPIHHHFEEGGMKETKVVAMFWCVAIVCCALAITITYL